jgi:hypothetical protein
MAGKPKELMNNQSFFQPRVARESGEPREDRREEAECGDLVLKTNRDF